MNISVLILTRNEEQDLPGCLESVRWSDDVHLFDSYSSDATVAIAERFGCKVTQRKFDNWSTHQNWGLKNIPFKHPWVLYLDADERVSPELHQAAVTAVRLNEQASAYRLRRRDFYSDGTWLKHAQISPFYIRLFRPERIQYERLVNPVSIVDGVVSEISGYLDHYPFSKGVGFWLERHLKYADLEAQTIMQNRRAGVPFSFWRAIFERDFTRRRFYQKELFYRVPCRPLIKLFYMLVIRRAFLDGSAGIHYATLQSTYEYFIVLKQSELERKQQLSLP